MQTEFTDKPEYNFSLILATYGRSKEIDILLDSLMKQTVDINTFEILIIDQNDKIDLSKIILKYKEHLHITHIKSKKKGLSYNRNIGLKIASGKHICFPDDDCFYYPDTLKVVLKHFEDNHADVIFGAIRDRSNNENIIRSWPRKDKAVTRYNFFNLYSSITIFTKRNNLQFNENLGVGCYFGSCEDSEYTYNLVKGNNKCMYFSDVEVWHPKIGLTEFNRQKNISYGLGFGAFVALNKYDIFILRFMIMSLGFHLSLALLAFFKGDQNGASKRFDAFTSRIRGFWEYSRK